MQQQIRSRWFGIQDSLWFLPATMTLVAGGLAFLLVQIDHVLWDDGSPSQDFLLIFGGGTDGARGVLAAIAGSLVTVTGTVYSITIVALQLAAGQFTPRVLRTFTGDRIVQAVLGMMIATFTYSLLVLRTVRAETDDEPAFIPAISTSFAIVLALASVAALIVFIHHISRFIQVAVIVEHAANGAEELIKKRYKDANDGDTRKGDPSDPDERTRERAAQPAHAVASESAGYIQALNDSGLLAMADTLDAQITVRSRIGDFVILGMDLVDVRGAKPTEEQIKSIRQAFVFGSERTTEADIGYGVRQIVDIALRAISPGINDPTTAIICIDRVVAILAQIARHDPPNAVLHGESGGELRLLPGPNFPELVSLAFTQIRHYGAADVILMRHVVTILGQLAEIVPDTYRAPLMDQAELALAATRKQEPLAADLAIVEEAGRWLNRVVA